MPPRKKQKTAADDTPAASTSAVPTRRMTRATTRAQSNAQHQSNPRRQRLPAKKAAKEAFNANGQATKRIVRKGRLQSLPDFALEIQLEIYSYLEPRDLLHLSRTCKKFRAFFLDRKLNEPLWRQARRNLDTDALPPRPPFMSEPAFIHLLYSAYCYNCGSPNVRKILPACFMRCCSKCLPERTVWYRDAVEAAYKIDFSLSFIFDYHNVGSYCPLLEETHRPYEKKGNRLLKEHVDHIFSQIKALPTPLTSEAVKAFKTRLQEQYSERLQYARPIHKWLRERVEERKANLGDSRKQRFEEIILRLRESGWDKELDFMGEEGIEEMSNFPVVRQSSKLTEGAWQKVLASLDNYLNETRIVRLDKEYRAAIRARFDALNEAIAACYVTLPRTARMDCRPQPIDFAYTPECKAIIDLPTSETVTAADFASVIPTLVAKWEVDRKKELTEFIRPFLGNVPACMNPLELAIACFTLPKSYGGPDCSFLIECMRYPKIFAHTCWQHCFHSRRITKEEFENDDQYTRTVKSLHWSEHTFKALEQPHHDVRAFVPFTLVELQAHPDVVESAVARMGKIVSALGLDPLTTTFEELEGCDTWLRCKTCERRELKSYNPRQQVYAYSWRGAYEHDSHFDHQRGAEWRHVDEEDYVTVHAAVEEASRKVVEWRWRPYYLRWSCSLCPTFIGNHRGIIDHLAKSHGIEDFAQAESDGTIYGEGQSRQRKCTGRLQIWHLISVDF
ncbi:hypothetical protein BV20DRAFT_1123395 [Pilatotrama ljubarskyi]|nr:hypothetical protein BV20DRAFT_1123395 [Pilatotrama ljubarskyi]